MPALPAETFRPKSVVPSHLSSQGLSVVRRDDSVETLMPLRPTPPRSGNKFIPTRDWPPAGAWKKRQRALAARTLCRLGIGTRRDSRTKVWSSEVLTTLGAGSFAEFRSLRCAGKVIWCNFDLARQLGFSVPNSNLLTPELIDQLLPLSLRAVAPEEDIQDQETVTMYADRYGGDGLGPALGAGRAGFLSYGNLYLKGIGFTPLFKHNDADDFAHSHGGVHLDDCLVEAVFGEVNANLFSRGSSRILAVIDQGKVVTDPRGRRIPIGIAVRTGSQLRPAHLLTRLRSKYSQLDKFINITRASGQLVIRTYASTGRKSPDLKATMLRVIDDHAQTAAEAFRWRMIHGALSSSNMEISGAMLDLPTQSTQPRTAPVWLLQYADSSFGSEHTARALHLAPVYRKLIRNVPATDWARLNLEPISFRSAMNEAYDRHLQIQLLCAAGIKKDVARRTQTDNKQLANSFTQVLTEMAALKNRGALCVARATVEQVAILNVFNLLREFPSVFFASPEGDHGDSIRQYLKPILRGNRFHVARKQAVIDALVEKFAVLYRDLMEVCLGYVKEYYGEAANLHRSVAARAAFENQPIERLYSHRLFSDLRRAIRIYKSTGDAETLRRALDERITASLRSVDGLLDQGDTRVLSDSGVELQMRTIDGVNYSVRAWNDAKQTRLVHIAVALEEDGEHYLTSLPALPRLTKRQLESLRLRVTGTNSPAAGYRGQLANDESHGLVMSFDIPVSIHLVARLEGTISLKLSGRSALSDRRHELKGFVFAIPDRQEINSMVARAFEE